MNKVYESDTMVVHDDREPLSFSEAFDILINGGTVRICYPPDYSAEDEAMIFDEDYPVTLAGVVGIENMKSDNVKQLAYEYLRSYEIYR